jgi:hypothetical protein
MLTNAQKALLARARREAGLMDDTEYRDAIELVTGRRTSTDPNLTDRDLDKLLAYFEAIHWRGADTRTLQPSCSPTAVFRRRGYWAHKNTSQQTSRDRFTGHNQAGEIRDLEAGLNALGFPPAYCQAIKEKICHGRTDAHALHLYAAALARTLKAKARHAKTASNPI